MSFTDVEDYFKKYHMEDRIHVFDETTATVQEAANVLQVDPNQIAKTMAFQLKEAPIVIVTEGGAKIANSKYKGKFGQKAKMVKFDELEEKIGHPAGGVCPFGLKPGVKVYLDESLKKHQIIYPAAGLPNSAIKLTLEELEKFTTPFEWVDVTK
ncbi:YbaK/EbsC family protein [Lactobacillus sp. ESL0791]|uniref:YbaK/EbsC family protein n=1 Tax=Lactobacillus sp. ESL0791 TaxID=2983234 RepID=UPI0023F93642|nr:YbaK/EbsC family protein [Lactobacillus sp. ESL0791]MDF7638330.1 YbaK/EbsC family protein [Lactobacillus sp. ESL0791]